MAGVDRMTVEDVVRRVLREEHGDVIASLGGAASRLRCSSWLLRKGGVCPVELRPFGDGAELRRV
jgi:hypothetical protein